MAYIVLTWHVSTTLMVHPGRIFVIEDVTPAELVPALAAALFSWTLLKVIVWPLTTANLNQTRNDLSVLDSCTRCHEKSWKEEVGEKVH